ncbi:uncharacterized protein LOC120325968 [Styela clava]
MDLPRNLSSSTPKSLCNINNKMPPSKRRAFESPLSSYTGVVPITPMPDFNEMNTPEIQRRAEKFGIKKRLAKTKLRTKLKEAYLYTHQIYSPTENTVNQKTGNCDGSSTPISSKSRAQNEYIIPIINKFAKTQANGKSSASDSVIVLDESGDLEMGNINHDLGDDGENSILHCISSSPSISIPLPSPVVNEKFNNSVANSSNDFTNNIEAGQIGKSDRTSFDLATNENFNDSRTDFPNIGNDSYDLNLSGVVQMGHDFPHEDSGCNLKKKSNDNFSDFASSSQLQENYVVSPLKYTPIKNSVPSEPCAIISLLDSSRESEHTESTSMPVIDRIKCNEVENITDRKSFPFALRHNNINKAEILANDSNDVSTLDDNADASGVMCYTDGNSQTNFDLKVNAKDSNSNLIIDVNRDEVISLPSDESVTERDNAMPDENHELDAYTSRDSPNSSMKHEDSDSQEDVGSDHDELHRSLFQSFHNELSSESEEEEECMSLMQRIMKKNQPENPYLGNSEITGDKDFIHQSPMPLQQNSSVDSGTLPESMIKTKDSMNTNVSCSFDYPRQKEFDKMDENLSTKTSKPKKVDFVSTKTGKILSEKQPKPGKKIKLTEEERTSAILKAIRSNKEIYTSILQYTPVYLSQFKQLMVENNIKVKSSDLYDFLDSRGITFSTADENKTKAVRIPKKKKKA